MFILEEDTVYVIRFLNGEYHVGKDKTTSFWRTAKFFDTEKWAKEQAKKIPHRTKVLKIRMFLREI